MGLADGCSGRLPEPYAARWQLIQLDMERHRKQLNLYRTGILDECYTSHCMNSPERLNKYLALHMGISRREADNLIEKGRVLLNDTPATLGARVQDETVTVNGTVIGATASLQYIALYKPVGYVCSRKPQGDAPTVYSLLPADLHQLKLVGRLDKDSSGLILLTNDGDFAFRMTHPKFTKTKVYKVRLDSELSPLHQQMIADFGVQLEDGVSQFGLMRLSDEHRREWQVTMSEGRNRQIRRTFTALGYTVMKLHRVQFGNYSLGDMQPKQYKTVSMQ